MPTKYRSQRDQAKSKRRCYICERERCWCTRHSQEKRDQAEEKFKQFAARQEPMNEARKLWAAINHFNRGDDDTNQTPSESPKCNEAAANYYVEIKVC